MYDKQHYVTHHTAIRELKSKKFGPTTSLSVKFDAPPTKGNLYLMGSKYESVKAPGFSGHSVFPRKAVRRVNIIIKLAYNALGPHRIFKRDHSHGNVFPQT